MNPILSRRTRVSSSSLSFDSAAPSSSISPELGRSRPPIRLSSVDFPEPEGPTIDTSSPRPMPKSTRSSAVTLRLPSKVLETPRRQITYFQFTDRSVTVAAVFRFRSGPGLKYLIERGLHLPDDLECRIARRGAARRLCNRTPDHQVIRARENRARGSGGALLVLFRITIRPDS